MAFELLTYYLKLPVFLLIAARMIGLVLFQPLLSAATIPRAIRVLLVLALSLLLAPFVDEPPDLPDTPLEFALALGIEMLLGQLIGLVVAIVFIGVQMGGTLIAQESGLAFGTIADPTTGQSLSVLSMVYMQLITVVYLVVGGHRVLLSICLDTFQKIPLLGENGVTDIGADLLTEVLTLGVNISIRIAAPAVLTLFLVNLAMGFISRTVPQLNIMTIGFSIKALIGFVIMTVSLPSAIAAFLGALDTTFAWLGDLGR